MKLLYILTVFWSALLLLLVQPMITKAILPWFGGSAGVWIASMLFFQVMLLAGYAYAHVLNQWLRPRLQALVHCGLLVLAAVFLPIEPAKPAGIGSPLLQILGLLAASTGLPYFLLSSTSPLLQAWYARRSHARLPWRLFAISNLGSLVALLAYPVAVEPLLPVHDQLRLWSGGFVVFAVLCMAVAFLSMRETAPAEEQVSSLPPWDRVLTWLALAFVPSVLWLGIASQLSQNVAAIPMLWILPLSIYLFSFVLTFHSQRWYRPALFRWLLPLAWAALSAAVSQQAILPIRWTILMCGVSLLLCCVFCHGEVTRLKPDPEGLTWYYLTLAAGGALGGFFTGVIAPAVFTEYFELPIALFSCILLALWLLYKVRTSRLLRIAAVTVAGTVVAIVPRSNEGADRKVNTRNFYGVLQVVDDGDGADRYRLLSNGKIHHGLQFLLPAKSKQPTTYYSPQSGVARTLEILGRRGPMRVGVIGLGAGTLATYGRTGDYYRFYEINPEVISTAQNDFTFLKNSGAKVEIAPGDARLSLEHEQPENFNLLVVDAFSGDSIPVHLLTREAMALYFRHLAAGGAIAFHVTNKHLRLAPVVRLGGVDQGAQVIPIPNPADATDRIYAATWVIVTKDAGLAGGLAKYARELRDVPGARLWTDDYSNLFSILH